jgi:hypothetical protein
MYPARVPRTQSIRVRKVVQSQHVARAAVGWRQTGRSDERNFRHAAHSNTLGSPV